MEPAMPEKADANPSPPQPTTQELLAEQIDRACRSGKYLILSVRVDGDRVWCERVSRNFPIADLEIARSLVEGEFDKLADEHA